MIRVANAQAGATLRVLRSLVATLCLFTASCSDNVIDTVFDPCSPQTIIPGLGTQESELQSIEDALQLWAQVLPMQLVVGEPSDTAPGLSIQFDSGDTFYRAIYFDNTGEILIGRDKLDPDDLALALAHELGHAFGLFHVPGSERLSVMNVGNLTIDPTPEDGLRVSDLWESCSATPD